MDDLTAFLRARLDEDEGEHWNVHSGDCRSTGPLQLSCDCGYPARVLREVEAKRAILDEHDTLHWRPGIDRFRDCQWKEWPCRTLRLIAAVYSDHPGYRPEWAP